MSDLLQRRRGVFGDKTTTANSTVVPIKRRKLNWNISFKFLVRDRVNVRQVQNTGHRSLFYECRKYPRHS